MTWKRTPSSKNITYFVDQGGTLNTWNGEGIEKGDVIRVSIVKFTARKNFVSTTTTKNITKSKKEKMSSWLLAMWPSSGPARIALGAMLLALSLSLPSARRFVRARRRRQLIAGFSLLAFVSFLSISGDNNTFRGGERLNRDTLVFVLAGQSNMAGRGGVTRGEIAPDMKIFRPKAREEIELTIPNDYVLRLTADLKWVRAREPLHEDIDVSKVCGIGPGLVFARELIRAKPERIKQVGLVPCAVGGTKIDEWEENGALYQSMILRSSIASRSNSLGAIFWYQGESDALQEKDAVSYERKLIQLIQNIRRDLGPGVPMILVAISGSSSILPFQEQIRQVIFRMPSVFDANIRVVDASGLELMEDGLHLSSNAQFVLGRKLTQTFLEMAQWD